MSLLSGGYPSRGCSLACFSMRRHGGEQAQWAVRSPMERRAKSQSNITAAGWKHTAKAVSEPRRQRNARQRQCLSSEGSGKHEAKAVSEPRRQLKTHGKDSVVATEAVETRGKDSVVATKAVENTRQR